MSYTSRAALEARFGAAELAQLSDRSAGSVVDGDVIAAAMSAADAIINPYLHAYDLTVVAADPDPVLGEIALHLARAALYVSGMPDDVEKQKAWALAMLDRISSGAMRLRVGSPAEAVDIGAVDYAAPDRAFTDVTMTGYGC